VAEVTGEPVGYVVAGCLNGRFALDSIGMWKDRADAEAEKADAEADEFFDPEEPLFVCAVVPVGGG
jgi:hypothetical protein